MPVTIWSMPLVGISAIGVPRVPKWSVGFWVFDDSRTWIKRKSRGIPEVFDGRPHWHSRRLFLEPTTWFWFRCYNCLMLIIRLLNLDWTYFSILLNSIQTTILSRRKHWLWLPLAQPLAPWTNLDSRASCYNVFRAIWMKKSGSQVQIHGLSGSLHAPPHAADTLFPITSVAFPHLSFDFLGCFRINLPFSR